MKFEAAGGSRATYYNALNLLADINKHMCYKRVVCGAFNQYQRETVTRSSDITFATALIFVLSQMTRSVLV